MENNTLELLKKYKGKIISYAILGFILCLVIIQVPYWIGDMKTIIVTDFSAESILGFLGDFLSAVGTVILGWIAMKQTDYANGISDRLLKLEERRYEDEHKPALVVDWVKLHDSSYDKVAMNVAYSGRVYYVDSPNYNPNDRGGFWEINIINTGVTGVYNCTVENVISIPEELKLRFMGVEKHDSPFNLNVGESIELNLYVHPDIIEKYAKRKVECISIIMKCKNNFGELYRVTLDVFGNIIEDGNRYEQMLVPTGHSIKWKLSRELIDE